MVSIPVPKLPIEVPANATITFIQELSTYTIDEATGNRVPDVITQTVQAALRSPVNKGLIEENIGSNLEQVVLKGYLINPKKLNSKFLMDQVFKITITDLQTGFQRKGELQLYPKVTPFNQALYELIGTPLEGFFRVVT